MQRFWIVPLLSLSFLVFLVVDAWRSERSAGPEMAGDRPVAIVGNPDLLRARYEAWKSSVANEEPVLVVPLAASEWTSHRPSGARGQLRLDLRDGTVEVDVAGLPADARVDAWLIGERGGTRRSLRPTAGDRLHRLGTLAAGDGGHALCTALDAETTAELQIDLVAIAPAGTPPDEGSLLLGAPTLFQRLYAAELRRADVERPSGGLLLAAVVPLPALAPPPDLPGAFDAFDGLVAKGEDLFFNETFAGNGRTCGTCHPAQNNLTIDAEFIDGLPPDDPLFVAEFIPALNHQLNGGRRFENPVLMRAFGLILENLDGFGDLPNRFTMRGVPHTFAQGISIQAPAGSVMPPNERTGWSGDGAPFGKIGGLQTFGTLRDFPVGAVIQHFTLRTPRVIDIDFRLPTPDELDAMEAFTLSLGRQEDLELRDGFANTLVLADGDAEKGKVLFRDGLVGNPTRCQGCHFNAGANVANGDNRNFNTGVELFLINHPDGTGEPRPIDGGFGRAPNGTFPEPPVPNPDGSFGNRTFNTPSLVEAADTMPVFHNNILGTLEDSIRFYQSLEFAAATGGASIPFDDEQVGQVAQFLRAINTLDNIENSALRFAEVALALLQTPPVDNVQVNRALALAIEDCEDCLRVLEQGDLHDDAQQKIRKAAQRFRQAQNTAPPPSLRAQKVQDGIDFLGEALKLIRL